MPDGSQVYSYVIPASSPGAGIRLDFDGTNYRAKTFGPTIVANASAANQAVALGQIKNSVGPGGVADAGSATSITVTTASWTAPSDGQLLIIGYGQSNGAPNGGTGIDASLAAPTKLAGFNFAGSNAFEVASLPLNAGDATTISFNFTTSAAAAMNSYVYSVFIPTP